jgi:hypothetical protein
MSVFTQRAKAQLGTDTPPAGNQPAVLVGLIDLGTHDEEYQGNVKKQHKLYLLWELVEAPVAGQDRNHVIGNRYTLSLSPKAKLREVVKTWRGRDLADGEDFDLLKLLGRKCFLTVGHQSKNDKTYANVEAVAPVPLVKGKPVDVADPKYKPFTFEVGRDKIEELTGRNWLPYCYGTPIPELVQQSHEWKGTGQRVPPPGAGKPDVVDGEVVGPDGNPLEDAPW